MSESAAFYPRYFGPHPVEFQGVVFGLEKFTDCAFEVFTLGSKEWVEVGDQERFGDFYPNVNQVARFEATGSFPLVTVRDLHTYEMRGYLLLSISHNLKKDGERVANEVAIYLAPEARRGLTARKLMEYTEGLMREQGVHRLVLGHRFDDAGMRIGKMYRRAGYRPTTISYDKVLT